MGLSATVGDALEILANVVGKRGHPGSCALKALPNIQEGRCGKSWDRDDRRVCCVVRGGC
jgi:hypothetical protein